MKRTDAPIPQPARPDRILCYFRNAWGTLLVITLTGIVYNLGLLAGPWFEGRLAQCLFNIFEGTGRFSDMLRLAALYVTVISIVQATRYFKRLYVRRFGNHVNRSIKHVLYRNLLHKGTAELAREDIGSVMTKAISDVDACSEGMRKFTTELFDTGVVLLGYVGLLLWYDVKLALLCLIFPPFAYVLAERMKKVVQKSSAAYKESSGRLSAATLDRVGGALTYRVFGGEQQRDFDYEAHLADYEKTAVRANIWVAALPPLYQVISMTSVLFILYFGAQNVTGSGWAAWDIAAFTTFLSCYLKLSVKSSKSAKLFNAVHKAEVSWQRIKPLLHIAPEDTEAQPAAPAPLSVEHLGFAYPDGPSIFEDFSLEAVPGQIIGVTGPVACGKSTLGRAFLCEHRYRGSIRFGERELVTLSDEARCGIVGYQGHAPELMSDSIENNILLGDEGDAMPWLAAVCMDEEVAAMPQGPDTVVGSSGVRLSGGQQARLALARTLCHKKPLLILDDPFAALDRKTEETVFRHLRALAKDSIVILISHRLYLFPQLDQVVWMENGKTVTGTHETIARSIPAYDALYRAQCEGGCEA